jgi:hypothetical protein
MTGEYQMEANANVGEDTQSINQSINQSITILE